MSTFPRYPIFEALIKHETSKKAVVNSADRQAFTYGRLVQDVASRTRQLHKDAGRQDGQLRGERVAMLLDNDYDYVVNLLSIMAADAIAVPLAPSFPIPELRYVLDHSEPLVLLASLQHAEKAASMTKEGLGRQLRTITLAKSTLDGSSSGNIPSLRDVDTTESDGGGLMLYTSGTTSRPKGVLLPTKTLNAQCQSLHQAWQYSPQDYLLHVLPLHHIHGVVNALLTPLLAGSSIEFAYPFNPTTILNRIAAPFLTKHSQESYIEPISFFTAVPTIYSRLLNTFPSLEGPVQSAVKKALSPPHMRLQISGSAALPLPTQQAWTSLAGGGRLLERYGMTEVGMALSCGLSPEHRVDGSVGWPLPGVQARLVSDDGAVIPETAATTDEDGRPVLGEVQLKGETIFAGYWRNEKATAEAFTDDGWFQTGDVASRRAVDTGDGTTDDGWISGPAWFIQGRASADIIKTGGEKISALEVERELLSLPEVAEAAVVGLPSEAWGQKVAAVVVLTAHGTTAGRRGGPLGVLDLRRLLRDRLAPFKIPQDLLVVDAIPRNAMGKVNKKELVTTCFGDAKNIRRRSVESAVERERLKKEEVVVNGNRDATAR